MPWHYDNTCQYKDMWFENGMFLQQKSNLYGMNGMNSYDMDLEIGKIIILYML